MMKSLIRVLAAGVLLAPAACSSSQEKPPPVASVHTRGQSALMSETLRVESVDVPHRTITLKSPEGRVGTFHVDERIKRLSDIKAGDSLLVQYQVAMKAELRDPTPEEKAAPIRVEDTVSRSPSSEPPTGSLTRVVRVVTTVDAVDPQAGTLTLKGPMGNMLTIKVAESESLSGIQPGRPIIASFAERLILAVEPGSKNQ